MVVAKSGLEAVFSVLLSYIYENGVPAILVAGWIAHYMVRIWRRPDSAWFMRRSCLGGL